VDVGDVLQAAVLDDPPADPGPRRQALADELGRWPEGRAHHHLAVGIHGEQETALIAHRVADDPKEPARKLVDVEHRADLGGEALEDRDLAGVAL